MLGGRDLPGPRHVDGGASAGQRRLDRPRAMGPTLQWRISVKKLPVDFVSLCFSLRGYSYVMDSVISTILCNWIYYVRFPSFFFLLPHYSQSKISSVKSAMGVNLLCPYLLFFCTLPLLDLIDVILSHRQLIAAIMWS